MAQTQRSRRLVTNRGSAALGCLPPGRRGKPLGEQPRVGGGGGPTERSQGRGARMGGRAGQQVSRGPEDRAGDTPRPGRAGRVLGPAGFPGGIPLQTAMSLYWVPWPLLGYTRAQENDRPGNKVTRRLDTHPSAAGGSPHHKT